MGLRILGRVAPNQANFDNLKNDTKIKSLDYRAIRNKAWRTLIDCGISKLPVNLNEIAKHYGWKFVKYSNIADSELMDIANGFLGFTMYNDDIEEYNIFFDDKVHPHLQRFTIAHEFGHIILNHFSIPAVDAEIEANMIASRILMPACILRELQAFNAEKISNLCNVSLQSAQYRAERLEELQKRNLFYTSPDEVKVLSNFQPYISLYNMRNYKSRK